MLIISVSVFLFSGCRTKSDLPVLSTSSNSAKLIVEEYELVNVDTDSPTHLEFMQRITSAMTEKRAAWKYLTPDHVVQDINTVLTKYGYRIEHDPVMSSYLYRLFKNYAILMDGIYPLGTVTENKDQTDFALLVQTNDGTSYILQKSGLQEWHPGEITSFAPIYHQNELIYPIISSTIQVISESGKTIYKTSLPSNPVMNPIQTFQNWNGHWILEKDGEVIMDGISLNKELGVEEIFDWQVIQGEPFFFVRENNTSAYSLVFAGQQLNHEYDEIVHYQCCEPAAFNPGGTIYMTWFFASRNGIWYYVEAGVYPEFEN